MLLIQSINCKWYEFRYKCNHPKRKKWLRIFKRTCPLVLVNRGCELQERIKKPEIFPLSQTNKRECSCPLCRMNY